MLDQPTTGNLFFLKPMNGKQTHLGPGCRPFTRNLRFPGCCIHGAGSAGLEDMFCPQDQPYTCTGTYTIEQDDINTGGRVITSHVSSVSPNGAKILDTTDNTVQLTGDAGITVGEYFRSMLC